MISCSTRAAFIPKTLQALNNTVLDHLDGSMTAGVLKRDESEMSSVYQGSVRASQERSKSEPFANSVPL